MAKKINSEASAPVKKWEERVMLSLTICLTIGQWQELFADEERKLMIARALNYCINKEELIVNGYLITNTTVWLVMQIDAGDISRFDRMLQDKMRKDIQLHTDRQKRLQHRVYNHVKSNNSMGNLFTQIPFVDDSLVKLITGKNVHMPYHDPQLARLKDIISYSRFCSAIDYSGAKGPVIVSLLNDNEE
jgi:hypothetical protein